MLTDIFAYRYLDRPIWPQYTETERRLLNQTIGIVKDALPYYKDGKVDERRADAWKSIHDRLARELGVSELSRRYYSYTQTTAVGAMPVSGFFTWDHVCEQFVTEKYVNQYDADRFIKERISFVEIAMRHRGEEIAAANANLARTIAGGNYLAKLAGLEPSDGQDKTKGFKAANAAMNAAFAEQVAELNERFRRARAPLTYHNGFIQLALDEKIEEQIAEPFWELMADPLWKNVDIDMKEALDRRDSNDKDPAIFAAKALESAVKIVSDLKGWTRGNESGAAQYIDNLMSKSNGGLIAVWEGEILKDYFRKVRNSVGHGPGSEPMPELSLAQTDWAIETAMSWVRSLVRRV